MRTYRRGWLELEYIPLALSETNAPLLTLTKSAVCTSSFHSWELEPPAVDFPPPPGGPVNPTALSFWMRCVVSTACSMLPVCTSRRFAFRLISSSTACLSFRCMAGARVPAENVYCLGSVRFSQSEHCQYAAPATDTSSQCVQIHEVLLRFCLPPTGDVDASAASAGSEVPG
jgi:hypothetical protein